MDNIKHSGEVSAIMGYDFQYSIFATEIYNALLDDNNQIEWIHFASNTAGKLDDVLISLKDSILAFQVKNINSSTLSYIGLTESSTQSIFEGMFLGWKNIAADNPNKRIDIRFITTQPASTNDKIKSYSGNTKPSFNDFLNNFWLLIAEGKYNEENLPTEWAAIFQELIIKVDSSSQEMIEFIKCTKFILEYSMPKLFDTYIERQRRIDIEDITKHIFQTIAKKGSTRYNKNDFLENFGLSKRYESYYKHSFFVDEEHYQPIEDTIVQLNEIITNNDRGYIALIGNAGSGKSTLLTKWIRNSDYRILKYYAYVNTDMNYEFGYRGEAKIFLHDLLIQIRQAKYLTQERLPTTDIDDLQKHFNDELNKLSREMEKVIIIVDGLDHIEREQDVTKSLLSILPLSDNIPENIYFILGSRTIENLEKLNPRIKNKIQEQNRIVNIKPLPKIKIQSLLSSYQIGLSDELIEKLFINTKGHPLFLRYTIEEIRTNNNDYEKLDQIISQRVFSGDIYNEYKVFWDRYKEQDDFVEILGLLARLRHSSFDIELLSIFPKITRLNQYNVNKLSENYFYRIGNVWQFFHSSFKEFLIFETAKNILNGQFDENLNKAFHFKIYESIRTIESEYKWNILYHLYKAESFSEITLLATQEFFRKQWFEFRSYKLIKEDIQLAIDASTRQKNIYSLFSCFLSIFEFKQRYNNFNASNYIDTFHQLGKVNVANSFIYDNVELLVSRKYALEYCVTLYKQNYEELSYDIFLRATPLFILNQSKSVSPSRYDKNTFHQIDELELISIWAKAASLFLSIEEVLGKIKVITIEEEELGYSDNRDRNLYVEASNEILNISIDLKKWDNLKSLEVELLKNNIQSNLFYFYLDIVNELSNENEFYNHCLQILSSWEISDINPINRRLLIIYLFKLRDINKSLPLFERLLPPNEIEIPHQSNNADLLIYIFDYSRFFYIIQKKFAISPIVFLPKESRVSKKIAVYNAVAELGKSYAYIYHDYKDAAKGYYSNFEGVLALFYFNHTDYEYDYSIFQNKALLINLVLKISLSLSIEIFNEILEMLSKDWVVKKIYWKTAERQAIIEWIIDANVNNEWCIVELQKIDDNVFEFGYLDSRIEKGITQIKLWSKLGRIDKGENILQHIMNISFDVRGEKDSQLDYILTWLKMFEYDTSNEIGYYLQRLKSIREKVNSPSHTPAKDILSLAVKYGNGFEIFRYLLFDGLISFNDSLELLLTYFLDAIPKYKILLTKLFTRVLLSFDNYHYSRHGFMDALFKSKEISITELKNLVEEISIYSISEYRDYYLYYIQEYALNNEIEINSIGIDALMQKPERYSKTEKNIIDVEGKKWTSTELIENINTIQELQIMQSKAGYSGEFNWHAIYIKILTNSTDEEILEFVEKEKKDSKELTYIAEILVSNNRKVVAKKLLYQAIQKGEKYGWVTFIDGGSKILPFDLLSKIEEKEIFQKEVFLDFSSSIPVFDIQKLEVLIKDVPKIWSYFSDNVNYNSLYSELANFKNELLKTQAKDSLAPVVNGSLDDETFLVSILYFLITSPSDFNFSLYKILLDEYLISIDILRPLLLQLFEEKFFLKYLKLLTVIGIKGKNIINEHKNNIIQLLNNKRYDMLKLASRLLESIGIDPKQHLIKEAKELSVVYTMKFDYKPSLLSSEDFQLDHINKKGFLKETTDPLVYVKLYLAQIKILSEETEISVLNIAYRVMHLGTSLEFPDWCNTIDEEEIRRIYSGRFNLEISYKRPRNQLVWDGLMQVVKELFELNLIDSFIADEISDEFDEKTYLIETVQKPDFIKSIIEKSSGSAPSANKEWAKQITDDYLLKYLSFKTPANCYILAEYTVLKGMGWGHAEETRQAFIGLTSEIHIGSNRSLIFDITSCRIDDYVSVKDKGIVLYNGLLTINKKRNWLAINPSLCKDLGLVYNESEGSFRWDDKIGNKIIESIYWQTHSTDNYSKNHNSETGYGWYVVLYENGYQMFKELIKNYDLYHHRKISRHMHFSQERYDTNIIEDFYKAKTDKITM